jgi:23S rRNA (adenine2503-C2)-methyltransferase
MNKINFYSLSIEEFTNFIIDIGEKPFRASQIWTWIYNKGAVSFNCMTNLSLELRKKLDNVLCISTLKLIRKTNSAYSKTQKFLWELKDGNYIESVYIPEDLRRTVCISTQVGCKLGCKFCATAKMGFTRNLECYEIISQILSIRKEICEKPTNIVVMGMGEPFLNYDNVIKALTILNNGEGIGIGHRKITISTAGIIPQLKRYTEEGRPFKVAISLNASTNDQRIGLMPITRKYSLPHLLAAAREYTKKRKRRLTFEYVLLNGVNDTPADAYRVLKLLEDLPCKLNLIAFNPANNNYTRPPESRIQAFSEIIRPLCAPVTLRLSKGDDIDAACGQLATDKFYVKSKINA